MKISFVIPAYNEEKRIKNTLQTILSYLAKKKFEWEIIVVDDGSIDETNKIVKNFTSKNKNIKLIQHKFNYGKGFAVKDGVLNSQGDYVLVTDADLSTPITELDKILLPINSYDVCIGSRFSKDSNILFRQPFFRELLGRLFNKFVKLVLNLNFNDTQCGFKVFKREAARKLFSKQRLSDFSFDVEILHRCKQFRLKVKEVGVIWKNSRPSKINVLKDGIKMLIDVMRIRFLKNEG